MRVWPIAFALVGWAAACSTFGGEGDDPGDADATAPEGSTTADGEAGGPTDGGATKDGATADARVFCSALDASSLLFCKDFEDGLSVNNGFQGMAGAPLLDTTTSTSPTHAMWAQIGGTYLRYDTSAASQTRQHVHATVYLGNFTAPIGDPRAVVLLRIVQAPGPGECVHELYARQDGAELGTRSPADGGNVSIAHPFTKFLETRRWTEVDIVLDQDLSAVNATVMLDGQGVLVSRRTSCRALAPNAQVFVGLISSTPGEARFDDFAFGSY